MAPLDFAHAPVTADAASAATEDPFFAAHRAWEAAEAAYFAAETRHADLRRQATAKYGEIAFTAQVKVGTNLSTGEPKIVCSDDDIDRLIAERIKGAENFSCDGRVSTEGGLVSLADVIERLRAKGGKLRANLRADEQRVAAIRAEFGLDEAEEAEDAAQAAECAAETAMVECAATTPAGVALKLRTMTRLFGWADGSVTGDHERDAMDCLLADIERLQPSIRL